MTPPKLEQHGAKQAALTVRRLLGVKAAADYVGISVWTLRDMVHAGLLPVVRLPSPRVSAGRRRRSHTLIRRRSKNGGPLRKLLFDVADLDALIARHKELSA